MYVSADKTTCAVSSLCVYRVPEVFDQDEDGAVEVLEPHPRPELRDEVLRAVRGCPTRSIHVDEEPEAPSNGAGVAGPPSSRGA
ncbi:ferredoxin [Amycolatopsis sp. NPDC059021]|uniref:ferredoxin n=1 Tax=Amycolatopsis sp. NPDC059021 TaxID=3346704 RepID=UPI0036709872